MVIGSDSRQVKRQNSAASHILEGAADVRKADSSFLAVVLLIAVLWYFFVPGNPFPDPFPADVEIMSLVDKAEGSLNQQVWWTVFFLLALVTIVRNLQKSTEILSNSYLLFLVVGICMMSILWSHVPDIAFRRSVHLFFVVTTALAVVSGIHSSKIFYRIILIFTGVIMVINFASVFLIPSYAINTLGNYQGMYSHKNIAANVAMISVFVWLIAAVRATRVSVRIVLICGAALWFTFLLGTGGKAAAAITILAPPVVFLCEYLSKRPNLGIVAGLSMGIAVVTTGFTFLILDYSIADLLVILVSDATLTGRTVVWEFVIGEIKKSPLVGLGFGSFWNIGEIAPVESFSTTRVTQFLLFLNQAHNGYLDVMLSVGLVGTLLWVGVLIQAVTLGFRGFRKGHSDRFDEQIRELYVLILFAVMVINITDSSFLRPQSVLNFFVIIGVFVLQKRLIPLLPARLDMSTRRALRSERWP